MPGITEIRRDVTREFKRNATGKLDRAGRAAHSQIFQLTVGHFAKKCARLNPPLAVWTIPKFRSFILGQTKKIAKEASKGTKNGVISAKALNKAAVKVMTKTQKFCKIAIRNGRIRDIRAGHFTDFAASRPDGDVCFTFLSMQPYGS